MQFTSQLTPPIAPKFAVIPVIEITEGRASQPAAWTAASELAAAPTTPIAVARYWIEQGASRLQVIDSAAVRGKQSGRSAPIAELVHRVGAQAQIDLVAGVRDQSGLDRAAATGAHRIVLDIAAVPSDDFLARAVAELAARASLQIVISAAGGISAPGSGLDGLDIPSALDRLNDLGVPHYVVCEAEQHGHWWSRHHSNLEQFCRHARRPVTAGSGVVSLEGLHQLLELVPLGLDGAVVGRPLAEGRFSFAEAQTAAEARFDPYQWGPARP